MKRLAQDGSRYNFQLTIKNILTGPKMTAGNQEIVYRDRLRMTYRDLFERIDRLGSALENLGVRQGDTVAVMDYDSHRYLESYFAIPMLGAILFTVNWRLSPDQIEYTLNHAETDVVFVNADFLPLLASIRDKLTTVKKVILLKDTEEMPQTTMNLDAEYEQMLGVASPEFEFPELDENTKATTFYTTGTTGLPKGVFFFSPPACDPHAQSGIRPVLPRYRHPVHHVRHLHAHHAHVPCPCLGCPVHSYHDGDEAGISGQV